MSQATATETPRVGDRITAVPVQAVANFAACCVPC